jgi:hypothetical protein
MHKIIDHEGREGARRKNNCVILAHASIHLEAIFK